MKKLLFLFTIVLSAVACSSDDDTSGSSNVSINPPSWIQGSWAEDIDIDSGHRLIFKTNDFCIKNMSQTICQAEVYSEVNNSSDVEVTEEKSNNYYNLSINASGSISEYSFSKISETEIYYEMGGAVGDIRYIKNE